MPISDEANAQIRKALDEVGDTGKNAMFELDIPMSTTGGSLVIGFNGNLTEPIAYPASREDIQSALELLPNIGENNVNVIGLSGSYRFIMVGDLAAQHLPQALYPWVADGTQLEPPVEELKVVELDAGVMPYLYSKAVTFYMVDHLGKPSDRLRFLYTKKDLLEILLGEAQKNVDYDNTQHREQLSQTSKMLFARIAQVKKEINEIENPAPTSGSDLYNTQAAATVTGRIKKRTSDGLPYGTTVVRGRLRR